MCSLEGLRLPLPFEHLSGEGRRYTARYPPPTHYSFKIKSFSLLSKSSIDKYTSDTFDEGGYKWTVSIHPKGGKDRCREDYNSLHSKGCGKDHISIHVGLVDTGSLPAGWEVNAIINIFVYNHIEDIYINLSDEGKAKRLHAMRTEWGVMNFISLDEFSNPSNGFLVDDTCVFGVDIFVLKQTRKGECLSLLDEPATGNHTWRIKSFSTLKDDRLESEAFVVGNYKWKIRIYPRGNGDGKGNSLSAFLLLDVSTLPPDTRAFVKFILRLTTQDRTKDYRVDREIDHHFGPSCLAYGDPKFISLAKLHDLTMGFLLNDSCNIEAQVTILGTVEAAC